MNIIHGPSKEHHLYLTNEGARYYVRDGMSMRDTFRDAGYGFLEKHHVVTWLGQDCGFAAGLAQMAKDENNEVILADPVSAVLMPLSQMVIMPMLDQATLAEYLRYRDTRASVAGVSPYSGLDIMGYCVAVCQEAKDMPQLLYRFVDGPDFRVHCEWSLDARH